MRLSLLYLLLILLFFQKALAAPICDPSGFIQKITSHSIQPEDIELIQTRVRHMDRTLIADAQKGERFSYWVDLNDQIHFSSPQTHPAADSYLVLKNTENHDAYLIKETGDFYFDARNKRYAFDSKKSIDLMPGEIDQAIAQQLNLKFSRKALPQFEKSRVMNCTEVLSHQQRGDNFIKDSVISSGIVTTASFATVELIHPSKKSWEEQSKLLGSDLVANTLSSAASSYIIKPLVVNKTGILKDFTYRTATDFGSNLIIKRPVYNLINNQGPTDQEDPDKKNIGNALLPYDTSFGLIRFFPKRALEKATLYQLPQFMIQSCLKNSALNFIVGPRSVRMVDRYTWGLIYMGGRQVYLNQQNKSEGE